MKASKSIKTLAAAMAVVMVMAAAAAAAAGDPPNNCPGGPNICSEVPPQPQVWPCGIDETSNVTCELSADGTFRVLGDGPMRDYEPERDATPEWYLFREWPEPTGLISPIRHVIIFDGITRIGRAAFWACDSVETVVINGSVTSIGEYAFKDNVSLRKVTVFAEDPMDINDNVFDGVDVPRVTLVTPLGRDNEYASSDKIWAEFADFIGSAVTHRGPVKGGQFGILQNGASLQIVGTTQAATLRVYDVRGRVMMSRTAMPNERISVSRLARGTYVVKAAGKSVKLVRR